MRYNEFFSQARQEIRQLYKSEVENMKAGKTKDYIRYGSMLNHFTNLEDMINGKAPRYTSSANPLLMQMHSLSKYMDTMGYTYTGELIPDGYDESMPFVSTWKLHKDEILESMPEEWR